MRIKRFVTLGDYFWGLGNPDELLDILENIEAFPKKPKSKVGRSKLNFYKQRLQAWKLPRTGSLSVASKKS